MGDGWIEVKNAPLAVLGEVQGQTRTSDSRTVGKGKPDVWKGAVTSLGTVESMELPLGLWSGRNGDIVT